MRWSYTFYFIICFYHLYIHDYHRMLKGDFSTSAFQHWTRQSISQRWSGSRSDDEATFPALPLSQICSKCELRPGRWWEEGELGPLWGGLPTCWASPLPGGQEGCFLHTWSQVRGCQWDPSGSFAHLLEFGEHDVCLTEEKYQGLRLF